MNDAAKKLYQKASFSVATVTRDGRVSWCNNAMHRDFPDLLKPGGLASYIRFAENWEQLAQSVEDNVPLTLTIFYNGSPLSLYFSPMPEKGEELLLTITRLPVSSSSVNPSSWRLTAQSVPVMQDIVSRLCMNLDSIRSGISDLSSPASVALEQASRCCSELLCEADRLALFNDLSCGRQPLFTHCNTANYFSELLNAVCRLLGEKAPRIDIRGRHDVTIDHELVGRSLLILISNGLEHDTGDLSVSLLLESDELTATVSNRIQEETPEEAFPDGLGFTLVHAVTDLHRGTFSTHCRNGRFTAVMTLPSCTDTPSDVEVHSQTHYLTDRFSPVYLEMDKFTPIKVCGSAQKEQNEVDDR